MGDDDDKKKIEDLKKIIKELEEENEKKQQMIESLDYINSHCLPEKSSTTSKYIEHYKNKKESLNGMLVENWNFKNWDIPESKKIEFNRLGYDVDNIIHEEEETLKLNEIFKNNFNKERKLQLYDGSTSEMMCTTCKPMKFSNISVRDINYPFEPYWIYITGLMVNKEDNLDGSNYKGQIFRSMEFVIGNHYYSRRPMFGFLMNNKFIKFFRYSITETDFKMYEITKNYSLEDGFQFLSDLIVYFESKTNPISPSLKILKTSKVEYFYGATSRVFIIDKSKVFKIFHSFCDYRNEVSMLKKLNGIIGIPSIIKSCDKDLYIQISPRGYPIDYSIQPASFYSKLVETIQLMHKKKVIHRDIRKSNILVYNNQPLLIDFGFAVFKGVKDVYQGTKSTASNKICQTLTENDRDDHIFTVDESDDLESLVKSFILHKEIYAYKLICGLSGKPFKSYKIGWDQINLKFPCYYKLFEYASNINYSMLKEEFLKN